MFSHRRDIGGVRHFGLDPISMSGFAGRRTIPALWPPLVKEGHVGIDLVVNFVDRLPRRDVIAGVPTTNPGVNVRQRDRPSLDEVSAPARSLLRNSLRRYSECIRYGRRVASAFQAIRSLGAALPSDSRG